PPSRTSRSRSPHWRCSRSSRAGASPSGWRVASVASAAIHLRVSHVTKRFGAVAAVNDVSFDVPKGAFATLLGPSGCGKTTTLRMIAGFYDPDAGALVIEPRVLLLDEPLSNLDAKLREQLRVELRTLQRRLGMTFVYVTHDQEEALSLSDWVAVMNAGRVEQAGSPWDIYYRPRTAFLADFVGAVNLVPARVMELTDGAVTVTFGPHRAAVRRPREAALSVGQDVRLCVRPESFTIAAAGPVPNGITFSGSVTRRAFLGDTM